MSDGRDDDRRAREEFDRIVRENLERSAPAWRTWRPPPPGREDQDPDPWWHPVVLLLAVVAVLVVLALLAG